MRHSISFSLLGLLNQSMDTRDLLGTKFLALFGLAEQAIGEA